VSSDRNRDLSTYCGNAGVVGQHQPAHPVRHRDVRAPLGQRHLDACWAPRDKGRQAALPNTQQALVHVCWVDLALDHVEDGDVAALLARDSRHHAVLGLQQPPHDV
jgi:hypothetical protein